MKIDIQPSLQNDLIKIIPLKQTDFETLYAVASNPLIWEQHPNKNRYQKDVFTTFFEGAITSKGAFLIFDQISGEAIGSSRYYDLDAENKSIMVGYTFIGCNYWGKGYNQSLKKLMFDYAFQFVEKVILHIGATNFRSQKAIEKLGGEKTDELKIAYYGEPTKLNFVYRVEKQNWLKR
ncbi:N-acetyltransferase [Pedobacter changchengzhani]|uniref:N-acetyltransferase n=1 Tax=Pedobacter changchengzhani TaxID=2529274 RepID=A0A4R5MR53_9SPHI|nr:GNAT family N-acetyltransferase [Pedobacter changchengzhani]TDG37879.1 N-acetyltransferase [Pedobacter changchengzhani]